MSSRVLAQHSHKPSAQSITTESIESGLDRKQLLELQRRFLALNQARLQRTLSALSYRQQQFLDLLPLLFHVNHPMLPGYVSQATPAGIAEYAPSKAELKAGKAMARSFRYQNTAYSASALEAIFVMGSMGTVAHNRSSDLDIWLCHRDSLSAEETELLREKCNKLTEIAKTKRLECHFFLMSAEKFRGGVNEDLSNEASGSTQHVLLLDEFYRTALWLAGRLPLWWFVPPSREQNYQDYRHNLLSKRFLSAKKVIDFGPVAAIPAEEFAGASLWQLYKAIEAPYKSVFKLLLLEAYTCTFPGFQPLCLSFKQQVYDGEIQVDELDPYIVAYRRIEYHLTQRKELQRLELVRRCLYFKIGKPLSKTSRSIEKSWRRLLLEKLVTQWQWSAEKIAELDQRRQWKADRVVEERKALVAELLNCYRRLQSFEKRHQVAAKINPQEFFTLGHKLYANYERRPGKIDWINPGISDDLNEAKLCFVEDKTDDSEETLPQLKISQWRVYPSSKADLDRSVNWENMCAMPLKRSSLMELILWCHCNELLVPSTRCEFIFTGQGQQNAAQVYPLIRAIQQWLPLPLRPVEHQQFQQSAIATHVFIHINLGQEPDKTLHDKGLVHISDIDDALGYGELKNNLVKSIDLVSRNSWNEVECQHFKNDGANLLDNNALALCLRTCLQLCIHPKRTNALPEIRVHCGSSASGNTIRYRVETLLQDVLRCFHNPQNPLATRYLFAMEKGFYACQCRAISDDRIQARLEALTDQHEVDDYLARSQARHSPITFDRYCHVLDGLRLIAKVSQDRAINVVYQIVGRAAELIVLDEQGSLFRGQVPFFNDISLLRSLHHFLRNVIRRQSLLGSDFSAEFDVFPIRFYKLSQAPQGQAYLEPCHTSTDLAQLPCFPVKVKASIDALGNENLELQYDQQVFSQKDFNLQDVGRGDKGERFFAHVREYILREQTVGLRDRHGRYPCYITDLDLNHYHLPGLAADQWQTSHYLRFKVDLEARLSAAKSQPGV